MISTRPSSNNTIQSPTTSSSSSCQNVLLKAKNKRLTSKSFDHGPPPKKAEKKTNKKKKNVRFPEKDDKLHKYYEIEHLNDLNDQQSLDRWWSTEEIEELKRECEADIYLLESGKKVEPRGLEHKTEEGAWKRYSNQRDALNALFGEIEDQLTELGYRSSDDQPVEKLDHERIAKAYRKTCKPTMKEALERALQDAKAARKYLKSMKEELPPVPTFKGGEKKTTISPPPTFAPEKRKPVARSCSTSSITPSTLPSCSHNTPPPVATTSKNPSARTQKMIADAKKLFNTPTCHQDLPPLNPKRTKSTTTKASKESTKDSSTDNAKKPKKRRDYRTCSFTFTPTGIEDHTTATAEQHSLLNLPKKTPYVKPKSRKAIAV